MNTKVHIMLVFAVLTLVPTAQAEDDRTAEIRERRHRIEQLRMEARQAEEKAELLRLEAGEIERQLAEENAAESATFHAEQVYAQLADLEEKAAQAEREGRPEVAREIRRNMDRLARKVPAGRIRIEKWDVDKFDRREPRPDNREAGKLLARIEGVGRALRPERYPEAHHAEHEQAERRHVERELDRLRELAERAERQGRPAEARELHQELRRLEHKAASSEPRPRKDPLHQAELHLEEIENRMRDARQRGDRDAVHALEVEARDIRLMMETERENRRMAEKLQAMERELAELNEAAEIAAREGRQDEARRLHDEAMHFSREIEERHHAMQQRGRRQARHHLERLKHEARHAEEQGRHDDAGRLRAELEEVERHLRRDKHRHRMAEVAGRLHRVMEQVSHAYEQALEHEDYDRAEQLCRLTGRAVEQIESRFEKEQPVRPESPRERSENPSSPPSAERHVGVMLRVPPQAQLNPRETRREKDELKRTAEQLEEKGWREEADIIRREIDIMDRQTRERPEEHRRRGTSRADARDESAPQDSVERITDWQIPATSQGTGPVAAPGNLERQVRTLAEAVDHLRREMGELRQMVKKKVR